MYRLASAAAIMVALTGPLMASNNDLNTPLSQVNKIEIPLEYVTAALGNAQLYDEVQETKKPTLQEFVTQGQADYAMALKAYMDLAEQNAEREINEILKPRTEVFQPCKDGLLMYKFLGITGQNNSVLQGKILETFSAIKSTSALPQEILSGAMLTIFMQNHLPTLLEMFKPFGACKQLLALPGITVLGDGALFMIGDEVDPEVAKLVPQAAAILADAPDLELSQEILDDVLNVLSNPVFVETEATEHNKIWINNVRGVSNK